MKHQLLAVSAVIPIPGSETSLDGPELAAAAEQEKTLLMDELKLMLEQAGKFAQMEKQSLFNTQMIDVLKNVPLPFYIG